MPTVTELETRAKALGLQVGREVTTAGLGKKVVEKMVRELEAEVAATAEAPAPAPAATEMPEVSVQATGGMTGAPVAPSAQAQASAALNAAPRTQSVPAPVVAPKPQKPKHQYEVAKGKAVTSVVGILGENDAVTRERLSGGQPALDSLVSNGCVVKNF